MATSVIGIDFGHAHIKLVEVRRSGRQVTIRRAALLPIPQGTIVNGALAADNPLAEVLGELAPKVQMNRTIVVAGITGPQVAVRHLTIDDVAESELSAAVFQEMAAALRLAPEEAEDYIVDYHRLSPANSLPHEVVAVGVARPIVRGYADLLRQARMAPHVLDLEAFALPRAHSVPGRMCYIEIGAEHTQIYVTDDGEYLLYRLVPTGIASINSAVSAAYDVGSAAAGNMLQRTNINTLVTEAPGDRAQLRRVLEEITGSVIQTLQFLRARQRASSITELLPAALLCGGGALVDGMAQLLSEETGLPVDIARPFTDFPGASDLPQEIARVEPLFSGALGLALRGVDGV